MSFSDRLANQYNEALVKFLQETHSSRAAVEIVNCLGKNTDGRYAGQNRNEIVKNLAEDVEKILGFSANLIFRSPGFLHDKLQDLLDEYLNWCDGILYSQKCNEITESPVQTPLTA